MPARDPIHDRIRLEPGQNAQSGRETGIRTRSRGPDTETPQRKAGILMAPTELRQDRTAEEGRCRLDGGSTGGSL
ncbi:hypothetical protein AAC387_Pa09g1027 [Persea americana]